MMRSPTLFKSALIIATFLTPISAKNYQYKPKPYEPYYAQNGSYRGEMSKKTYKPKNDYVRPYNHKDGSRVRSHYKSRKNR